MTLSSSAQCLQRCEPCKPPASVFLLWGGCRALCNGKERGGKAETREIGMARHSFTSNPLMSLTCSFWLSCPNELLKHWVCNYLTLNRALKIG